MKTDRNDIERNKQQTHLPYGSGLFLGYSRCKLMLGDLFLYAKIYVDGTSQSRLAKYHGRIRPINTGDEWLIFAQTAGNNMQHTYECWVKPENVIETIPADRVNPHIAQFFAEQEDLD